jgi:hypothetical protein
MRVCAFEALRKAAVGGNAMRDWLVRIQRWMAELFYGLSFGPTSFVGTSSFVWFELLSI